MNNKALIVSLIIFGLLLAALVTRNGNLAWMALPFLALLVAGILQSTSPQKTHLQAERSLSKTGTAIAVNIAVKNIGEESINVRISDPLQPGMKIIEGNFSQLATMRQGEELELRYTFRGERGSYAWKTLQVFTCDPLAIVETEWFLPAHAEIQIQPEMVKFRPIPMRLHRTLHSPGSIPARLGGSGTDFWGVREYHPGDSLRWLDWRLTARYPRKFFTKEFEQEEIADIGLILDARSKTDLRIGEDSLFEHSTGAAASLAEMFIHQGHRVSLLIFGEKMLNVFPGYGKVQLQRILRCLSKASIGSGSSLESFDYLPIRMFSSHSLIVLISPLSASDWPFFPRLRACGYQGLVISPDPVNFAVRSLPEDPASRLAIRAARVERSLELRNIAQLSIPVIDWPVNQPLYPLVRNAFIAVRRQRQG